MKKFAFMETKQSPFSGKFFYKIYKHADFLSHDENITTILTESYQLRQAMKDVVPGEKVTIQDMWLTNFTKDTALKVKKSGPNVIIKNCEFTINRLTGLTAAYAYDNRSQYPKLQATEAEALGLHWDYLNSVKSKLYLASVSGTEHHYEQFSFWPLVCALKKIQLKKITVEPVIKMAKVKNNEGIKMSQDMKSNWKTAKFLWTYFEVSKINFNNMFHALPKELKQLFD